MQRVLLWHLLTLQPTENYRVTILSQTTTRDRPVLIAGRLTCNRPACATGIEEAPGIEKAPGKDK